MSDRRRWANHPLVQLTRVRYREFFREPEAVFWVFIFPVLLAAGLGIAFRNRSPERSGVAVVMQKPGSDRLVEALQKVEELRAGSWAELQPGTDTPAAGFTRTWTVTPMGADPDHLVLLEVLVGAPGGRTRMVALKTKPPEP